MSSGVGAGLASNMTQHRLACVAVAALAASVLLPTAAYADSGSFDATRVAYGYRADNLRDLDPAKASPFDGARARIMMLGYGTSTFDLKVRKVGAAGRGQTYGAHLHAGPCRTGKPLDAGDHYNVDAVNQVTPKVISAQTEVWLDFTVDAKGRARAAASVPFVPKAGVRSIVIHAEGTNHETGAAGARLACLPVTIR